MSDFLEARYKRDDSVVYREIAGEGILVPIRRNVADLESIYTLNGVGMFIWQLVDGQRNNGQIKQAILDEYQTCPEDAETDLREFLHQLESMGAIVRA